MTAAMCACGKVWLLDGIDRWFAENAEHTRDWCRGRWRGVAAVTPLPGSPSPPPRPQRPDHNHRRGNGQPD